RSSDLVRSANRRNPSRDRRSQLRRDCLLARSACWHRQVAADSGTPGSSRGASRGPEGAEDRMTPLGCAAVRRLLDAYHDRELSIEKHIAVDAHLDVCVECVAWLEELRLLRSTLRATCSRTVPDNDAAVFAATVVNRWKAERQASMISQVASMFEDLHLVYAGLGAAVATAVCVVGMLGMMRFATLGRPDSLGALVNFLSMPGAGASLP